MDDPQKSGPRERILHVANHLFYTEGVRATGTEKIMANADVAKATFYRHFESKDALVLAYLDYRDQFFWQYLAQPAPPTDLQEALLKIEQLINHPEVTGCPFLRVASEYPDLQHPFHRRVVEHKEQLRKYLADLMKPHAANRKAIASELLCLIDGALSTRMLYGSSKKVPLSAMAQALLKAA